MVSKKTEVRIERDKLGEVQVPAQALWGLETARNLEIVQISHQVANAKLIDSLVMVKKSAALANAAAGRLDPALARAISQAADEVLHGQWHDQFVADAFQLGAGTSLIANVNEVLANRAAQLLGATIGTYDRVHPRNHVDLGQSSNDVFPTAMRLAILLSWRELEPVVLDCERLLRRKSLEFEKITKVGRNHLQDSVPITLGQEFNAYGSSIGRSLRRIKESTGSLYETNLGCTAVGTGFGTDPTFAQRAVDSLVATSGYKFRLAEDVFRVTQSMADFVEFSSTIKELAIELSKIAADLRLMSSGPHAGFGEINIGAIQPEPSDLSPILPDKKHPYLIDALSMVCYQVIGNDMIVSLCAQTGQLDNNAMTPLLINSILQSLDLLRNVVSGFNSRCLSTITANAKRCQQLLELSGASAAAITIYLGEPKATELLSLSLTSGKTVRELIIEQNLLSADVLDRILHYKSLTRPSNIPIGNLSTGTAFNTNAPIDNT